MAIVMLVSGRDDEPVVGPEAAGHLGALGITRISLLRDGHGVAVVLEGWAFDPARVDDAARAVFPGSSDRVRILREIEQVAVAVGASERST